VSITSYSGSALQREKTTGWCTVPGSTISPEPRTTSGPGCKLNGTTRAGLGTALR